MAKINRDKLHLAIRARIGRISFDGERLRTRLQQSKATPLLPLSVVFNSGTDVLALTPEAAASEFIEECKRQGIGPTEFVQLE